jgi:DnaJ-class molecular chaperone
LHVRVQVWTPERLTPEQAELFRRLRELENEMPEGESLGRRFWNRMREALGG